MEYGPRPTDTPSAPSPPPTPAPVPVPLPPSTPAPVSVPKIPANVTRQNSSSSDSGGSIVRDNQRHKQLPVDRKFPREATICSFSHEWEASLSKILLVLRVLNIIKYKYWPFIPALYFMDCKHFHLVSCPSGNSKRRELLSTVSLCIFVHIFQSIVVVEYGFWSWTYLSW